MHVVLQIEEITGVPAWWTLGLEKENGAPHPAYSGAASAGNVALDASKYTPWDLNPEPTDYTSEELDNVVTLPVCVSDNAPEHKDLAQVYAFPVCDSRDLPDILCAVDYGG